MASKIILKKSNVASKVPVVGDLDFGELALNYTDGKLWYKNNSNVITQLNSGLSGTVTVAQGGTGLTSYTANGILYASGTTTLASGSVLTFDGSMLSVNSINIGRGAGNITTNTAVGTTALNSNTSGSNNTSFGYQALFTNSTNANNTAIGYKALYTSNGNVNTAVGSLALTANADGSQNTGIGVAALSSNTSGSSNSGLGNNALGSNTTGTANTALGVAALTSNISGGSNTASGNQSLSYSTSGDYNTAVGWGALNYNSRTVVAGNFVIGVAYTIQSTGTTNFTLIGAANSNVGTVFTATGVGTGTGTASSNASFNTAVGFQALQFNITGNNNVGIGYASGAQITTGSNNVVLGGYTGSAAPISITGSNYIVLSNGAGNVRLYSDPNGDVYINTGSLREVKSALGANNIDLSTGNYFTKTITGATTLTVSNIPATGRAISFILDLTNGGLGTITWWTNMKWVGGIAPTLTAAGRDSLGFYTHDGGTTWTGLLLGKDIK